MYPLTTDNNKITKIMLYKHDVALEAIHTIGSEPRCVILYPPHPSLGGTMSNRVLKTVDSAFVEMGFSTFRINFRGVGASQGTIFDRSNDISDSLGIFDHIINILPDQEETWVGGFGYGAHISINVSMRRPGVSGFVAVTPHYVNDDGLMSMLAPCPDGLILNGLCDKVVNYKNTKHFASNLCPQDGSRVIFNTVQGADHNYINKHTELKNIVLEYIRDRMLSTSRESETFQQAGL